MPNLTKAGLSLGYTKPYTSYKCDSCQRSIKDQVVIVLSRTRWEQSHTTHRPVMNHFSIDLHPDCAIKLANNLIKLATSKTVVGASIKLKGVDQ